MAVRGITVGAFNLTAVLTMHRHWLKDEQGVAPITEPIIAWMDQLPARQQKAIEEKIIPALLAVGVAEVLIPDIVLEVKLRNATRHRRPLGEPPDSQGDAAVAAEGGPGQYPEYGPAANPGGSLANGQSPSGDDDGRPPRIPGVPF
jgi:hypothetical protein